MPSSAVMAEPTLPAMWNDLWWDYVASCTGNLIVGTLAPEGYENPDTTLAVYRGVTCPPDTLVGSNDDAEIEQRCTIGGRDCREDADCIFGCTGPGPQAGQYCATDYDCPGDSTCDTRLQGACDLTGAPCGLDADCHLGICENDPEAECDATDPELRCPDGTICATDDDCPNGGPCAPECGWREPNKPWRCLPIETCTTARCASNWAPASLVTVPVFEGEVYKIRLGGEYGSSPEGFISIECVPDDCNGNGDPDAWEIEQGLAEDCNQNGEPDSCDIESTDPDGNGTVSADCDGNGVPDECQISAEAVVDCSCVDPCYEGPFFCYVSPCAPDLNGNGIPDICDCGDGAVIWLDPPDGAVDARQPHPLYAPRPEQGLETFEVQAPGLGDRCWLLTETTESGSPNEISRIVDNGDGTFTIILNRPITPGELTQITYTSETGVTQTGCFAALPGDADGDRVATANDINYLIDCLNWMDSCPRWQADIDHSATGSARDILRLIDLLNGAGAFEVWMSRTVPACP